MYFCIKKYKNNQSQCEYDFFHVWENDTSNQKPRSAFSRVRKHKNYVQSGEKTIFWKIFENIEFRAVLRKRKSTSNSTIRFTLNSSHKEYIELGKLEHKGEN